MGLFSDKCTAIVSLKTKRCLTGAEFAEAERILAKEKGVFHSAGGVLAQHGWGICGHGVRKEARFCSKCGAPAPGGWTKCPSCGEWVGNEMTHCWDCSHELHPGVRADVGGGVWSRAAGLLAQRFEVGEVENMLKNGIQVQEGSIAILIDAGKEKTVVGPSRHDPDSTLLRINWFGNPPPRSFVLVDAGEFIVPLRVTEGHVTSENYPMSVYAELTLQFVHGRADDFMANFMKDSRAITYEELAKTLSAVFVYAIKDLCTTSSVGDLVKDPERRDQFEAMIRKVAGETLKAWGFEVVRVGAADFDSPKYREIEGQNADLVEKRRQLEFLQKTRELINEDAAKNRQLDADERDTAAGTEMDAAKAGQDLSEYMAQLAQEKEISGFERDTELKLVLMAKRHEITAQEANYRIAEKVAARAAEMEAELKEVDHDIALKEKLRAYTVEAMHKDDLGQEEKLEILVREKELKAAISRTQIELEAYRTRTLNAAKSDAQAYDILTVGGATNTVESGKIDNELKRLKGLREIDRDIDETKMKARAQELDFAKDAPVESLIAQAEDDPEKMKALVEFARVNAQKDMATDQLLAVAAATSDAAANAFAAKAISEKETMNRLVEEIKKIAGDNSAKDERLLATLAGVMVEAAKRPGAPPPPPPPTQQIIE